MKFYSKILVRFFRLFPIAGRLIGKLYFLSRFDNRNLIVSNEVSTEHNFEANSVNQIAEMQTRILRISHFLQLSSLANENLKLKRYGSLFDGGYFLQSDLNKSDYLISLGVGSDISFDADLSNTIKGIDLYDHTVSKLPIEIENSRFFKEEIGYSENKNQTTLEKCQERLGEETATLLKIDIEGAEWDLLNKCNSLENFKQVVVEFHDLHNISNLDFYTRACFALEKLRETHIPVFIKANNYGNYRIIGNCPLPDVIEVTYLNFNEYEFLPIKNSQNGLGNPNAPHLPDIYLSFPARNFG